LSPCPQKARRCQPCCTAPEESVELIFSKTTTKVVFDEKFAKISKEEQLRKRESIIGSRTYSNGSLDLDAKSNQYRTVPVSRKDKMAPKEKRKKKFHVLKSWMFYFLRTSTFSRA
jgi:hypothetical protein